MNSAVLGLGEAGAAHAEGLQFSGAEGMTRGILARFEALANPSPHAA